MAQGSDMEQRQQRGVCATIFKSFGSHWTPRHDHGKPYPLVRPYEWEGSMIPKSFAKSSDHVQEVQYATPPRLFSFPSSSDQSSRLCWRKRGCWRSPWPASRERRTARALRKGRARRRCVRACMAEQEERGAAEAGGGREDGGVVGCLLF